MSTAVDPPLPTSRNWFQLTSPQTAYPHGAASSTKAGHTPVLFSHAHSAYPGRSLALSTHWLNALKGAIVHLGGCWLGHGLKWWKPEIAEIRSYRRIIRPCPSVPVSPSVAFSSRLSGAFPFLNHFHILLDGACDTICKHFTKLRVVCVWGGGINMVSKPFHQIEAFPDLFDL